MNSRACFGLKEALCTSRKRCSVISPTGLMTQYESERRMGRAAMRHRGEYAARKPRSEFACVFWIKEELCTSRKRCSAACPTGHAAKHKLQNVQKGWEF